jgi:NAD(P)-dependent dehydrogenase (short-subunit alcohol dehydrogenase family)
LDVDGKRVLVVGASAGVGRAIALTLAAGGARVAVTARRRDLLEAVAKEAREAGGDAIAAELDVRDSASCEAAVSRVAAELGGLDAMVYTPGMARPRLLAEADASEWTRMLETNLIGASLITRAALHHLQASRGRALYLSSITADDPVPRRGMALYATSKAALNKLIEAWRGEHPEIAFTRLQLGDTGHTEFGLGWSEEELAYVQEWVKEGLLFGRFMKPESVAAQVQNILSSTEDIPHFVLQPRRAVD